MRHPLIMILLSVAFLGCANSGTREEMNPQANDRDNQAQPGSHVNQGRVTERALTIASEQLGVARDELEVVSADGVDWPDSSLGCPKPGVGYMQVITPGHKVVLRHGNRLIPVHLAQGHGLVCTSDKAGMKELQPRILRLPPDQLAELARANLAQRLGVARDEIQALSTNPVEWQDTSLGCPQKGQEYEQKPTRGFVIRLAHQGDKYRYHSDQLRVFPCPPVASE